MIHYLYIVILQKKADTSIIPLSVCVSCDWQREDVVCSAEEEMSARDKRESADNVPAAAPAPSQAAHTLTAGCDRGCRVVFSGPRCTNSSVTFRGTMQTRWSWIDEKTRVYLSHLYKWGTGWAHSLQAKYVLFFSIGLHTHTHTPTHTHTLYLSHTHRVTHLHWQNAATHFQGEKSTDIVFAPQYWSTFTIPQWQQSILSVIRMHFNTSTGHHWL